jgi:hypothetical protein
VSQSIWTQCGGSSDARRLAASVWRVVEAQFITSTRKLVDSDAEQGLLERLIDGAKPPVPAGPRFEGLHYLLSTPFRHPPLRNGSRFGTRLERGLFYASMQVDTALAEVAYYRLVFLSGTQAALGLVETEHTAFQAAVATERGVDLTRPPFTAYTADISSPKHYEAAQQLGQQMRAEGIELACFTSARDPRSGTHVVLFEPAFASRRPRPGEQTWVCHTTARLVELKRKNLVATASRALSFPRNVFLVDGQLPVPAL